MSAEQTRRQKEQRFDERERRMHTDTKEAERQGDQPHKRRQNQSQQRQRPAHREQQAPEQKDSDDFHEGCVMITRIDGFRLRVFYMGAWRNAGAGF